MADAHWLLLLLLTPHGCVVFAAGGWMFRAGVKMRAGGRTTSRWSTETESPRAPPHTWTPSLETGGKAPSKTSSTGGRLRVVFRVVFDLPFCSVGCWAECVCTGLLPPQKAGLPSNCLTSQTRPPRIREHSFLCCSPLTTPASTTLFSGDLSRVWAVHVCGRALLILLLSLPLRCRPSPNGILLTIPARSVLYARG